MARKPAVADDLPLQTPSLAIPARIGIGGWDYAPWRRNFYPDGLPQRRELEYASRQLNAIEVNGTHYRGQTPATYANWREQTPPGFLFSLKAPMAVTHRGPLAGKRSAIEDFIAGVLHLQDRLGPLLWQFDEARPADVDDLAAFAAMLPRDADGRRLRHVFELRNPAAVNVEVLAIARKHGIATVFTDSSDYPSFADLHADFVYARLMRSRSDIDTGYPMDELRAWAERIRTWTRGEEPADLPHVTPAAAPAAAQRDVFVYFISAAKERNPAAAKATIDLLG